MYHLNFRTMKKSNEKCIDKIWLFDDGDEYCELKSLSELNSMTFDQLHPTNITLRIEMEDGKKFVFYPEKPLALLGKDMLSFRYGDDYFEPFYKVTRLIGGRRRENTPDLIHLIWYGR